MSSTTTTQSRSRSTSPVVINLDTSNILAISEARLRPASLSPHSSHSEDASSQRGHGNQRPHSTTPLRNQQSAEDIANAAQEPLARHRQPQLAPASNIIGAPLGENLSAIEAADALVERWERIYDETLRKLGPEAVTGIAAQLEQARADRAELDFVQDRLVVEQTFEDTEPYRKTVVAHRIDTLRELLEDTPNEAGRANIRATINCYQDGSIPPSDQYALIYAGHLMEFAPTYGSFTDDRTQRLERYAAEHGEGWLWWEPPLVGGEAVQLRALSGTSTLTQDRYPVVTMSFQGVRSACYGMKAPRPPKKSMVSKATTTLVPKAMVAVAKDIEERPQLAKQAGGGDDDGDGDGGDNDNNDNKFSKTLFGLDMWGRDPKQPRLCFRMMLDSGASFPCLHRSDLEALNIYEESYPAVTGTDLLTAGGMRKTKIFEMYVTVVHTETCESLVDRENPVWPDAAAELGGITPVMLLEPEVESKKRGRKRGKQADTRGAPYARIDGNGGISRLFDDMNALRASCNDRLSGILPFRCCYVQSTPPGDRIWLGEDRRDVLGLHRMPGQRRWEPGTARKFDTGWPDSMGELVALDRDGGNPDVLRMVHNGKDAEGSWLHRLTDLEHGGDGSRGRSEIIMATCKGGNYKMSIKPRDVEPRTGKVAIRRAPVIGVKKRKKSGPADQDQDWDQTSPRPRKKSKGDVKHGPVASLIWSVWQKLSQGAQRWGSGM